MQKLLFATVLLMLVCLSIAAQDHDHHKDHLHFSHPMVTESASPDTKLRFDYGFFCLKDGKAVGRIDDHTARVEFENAFSNKFSVSVTVPYTFRRPETSPSSNHLDNIEINLKAVTFAVAEHGLLPVYGISLGLPTGNEEGIGDGHVVEIEPFAGLGFKHQRLELIGFARVSFKANRRTNEEEGHEFGYNFSSLYSANKNLQVMLEMDGRTSLTGEPGTVINLSPGVKLLKGRHWQFGASFGWPVTHQKDFDIRGIFSVFYHF